MGKYIYYWKRPDVWNQTGRNDKIYNSLKELTKDCKDWKKSDRKLKRVSKDDTWIWEREETWEKPCWEIC